jgi:hypothetical protein
MMVFAVKIAVNANPLSGLAAVKKEDELWQKEMPVLVVYLG